MLHKKKMITLSFVFVTLTPQTRLLPYMLSDINATCVIIELIFTVNKDGVNFVFVLYFIYFVLIHFVLFFSFLFPGNIMEEKRPGGRKKSPVRCYISHCYCYISEMVQWLNNS